MELNDALVTRLRTPMRRVWSEIGPELRQLAAEEGEPVDNKSAVESCIDADCLMHNGQDTEANSIMLQAVKEHGYPRVLEFLCKHFKFA